MAIYRSATILMTAVLLFLVSVYARAQSGQTGTTFPKPATAMSQDLAKPHIGLIAGVTNPEASFATRMEYGLDAGFQPWAPFSLGMEVTGLNSDRKLGAQPQDLNRTNILVKGPPPPRPGGTGVVSAGTGWHCYSFFAIPHVQDFYK